MTITSPRFTGSSWLAFPALRGAYKHVQLTLELRPEAYDGIFFLTGERDDMAGDFMALLLHQGFVEFRYVLQFFFNLENHSFNFIRFN